MLFLATQVKNNYYLCKEKKPKEIKHGTEKGNKER